MEIRIIETRREIPLKIAPQCGILLEEALERNCKAMQYMIVHRDPKSFLQAVALEQIQAMCKRAFGQGTSINSVRELDGGQFNNIYLIELANCGAVVLRVTPSPERAVFWHERCLMRRELAMQPFLAPLPRCFPPSS